MTCKNCDTLLTSSSDFCNSCGAKVIRNRLTIKNLFQYIGETFLNYDNKFLRTFIHLFTKPEFVITNFINGTRKKHISVIQYFAISLTLVGIQVFLMNTFFKGQINESMSYIDAFNNNLPNQNDNPFKDIGFEKFNNYQNIIYILTIPFISFSTWISYRIIGDKRFNFTEHTVINLYYSSQVIIITAVISIILLFFNISYLLISSVISGLSLVYLFYILKRVFSNTMLESFSRFLLVLISLAVVCLIIFIIGVIAVIIYLKFIK
ncbi:MAG: DUF3667 domain-containing protein [Algibacter sp.]